MKKIVFVLLFVSVNTFAQDKYLTKTGNISFEASVPSFEEVAAKNNSVTAILNTENGEFAALVLVKGFRFKNALMEEHFNENYAESDDFPKATFKGNLTDFSLDKLGDSETAFKINGTLTFHGVTQTFEDIVVKLVRNENGITISGGFEAKASQFDIEIPSVVSKKVKDEVGVNFSFELIKK